MNHWWCPLSAPVPQGPSEGEMLEDARGRMAYLRSRLRTEARLAGELRDLARALGLHTEQLEIAAAHIGVADATPRLIDIPR